MSAADYEQGRRDAAALGMSPIGDIEVLSTMGDVFAAFHRFVDESDPQRLRRLANAIDGAPFDDQDWTRDLADELRKVAALRV